jgi:uncharacterized repeat protein (TIGR01451 family)
MILVLYENTSGNADPAVGSNFLASFPVTVQALDTWNVYTLPTTVTFNGPGDVLVGVIGLEIPGTSYWPASMDQTTTQSRSWAGWWLSSPPPSTPTLPPDDTWILIDVYFPGNWMVRANGETITTEVPWLSESPITGTLAGGSCQDVDVTFDSAGMSAGEYFASLDINSNDPQTPVVNLPVSMTVEFPLLAEKLAPATAEPGDTFQYTINVDFPGPIMGTGLITDVLPLGVEFAGNLTTTFGTVYYDAIDNAVYWYYGESGAASPATPVGGSPLRQGTPTASDRFGVSADVIQDGSFELGTPNPYWTSKKGMSSRQSIFQ